MGNLKVLAMRGRLVLVGLLGGRQHRPSISGSCCKSA